MPKTSDNSMNLAHFFVGQIVEHTVSGYRGVVFEVDAEFGLSQQWYEQVARSRPPKDRPWYHVIVDGETHTTYVAQRHLISSNDLRKIEHPGLSQFFARIDGSRYLPVETLH